MVLICPTCEQLRDASDDFQKRSNRPLGRQWQCKYCQNVATKNWYLNRTPVQIWIRRRKQLLRQYGMTLEDYDAMAESQGGVCAICHNPETQTTSKRMPPVLAVDHDRETGLVRGLLCAQCNQGIGKFRHQPSILESAIDYLERS